MAPYQVKGDSKPTDQPLAGDKVLTGRVEKQQNGSQPPNAFLGALTFRPKNQTVTAALTDQINQESLITKPPSTTQTITRLPESEDSRFSLQDAIPKSGLRFPGEQKGKRPILGKWKVENMVAEALCADMNIVHKRHAQSIISPIFHQAAELIIKDRYLGGLVRHEDVTDEEGRHIWKLFMAKLWVVSNRKWPHRLSQNHFIKFFSALAEARWMCIHQPKPDQRDLGLLVQSITRFLDAADEAGLPWSKGGDAFSDDDDDTNVNDDGGVDVDVDDDVDIDMEDDECYDEE